MIKDGGYAFPMPAGPFTPNGEPMNYAEFGMSLRDYFAAQAMANAAICTGTAPDYELRRWFGGRGGVTRAEIVAAQALDHADALLARRGAQ